MNKVIDFVIEDIEEMPEGGPRSRTGIYDSIYKMAREMPIDAKKKVGPFMWSTANAVQSHLTGRIKTEDWKIKTSIKDENGKNIPVEGRKERTDIYLYFQKVRIR